MGSPGSAKPRVIVISIDGLAAFYWDDPEVRMPTLRRLAGQRTAAEGPGTIADVTARPSGWLASALSRQPLVGIGRISYGLYLWHLPLVYGCGALAVDGAPPDFPRATLAIALTFLIAGASYRWIETPMLRIKRRFTR